MKILTQHEIQAVFGGIISFLGSFVAGMTELDW